MVAGLALSGLPALAYDPVGNPHVDIVEPVVKGSQKDYADRVQRLFKQNQWAAGKKVLDEGMGKYEFDATLNRLMGSYWLHYNQYDRARYYLIRSLRAEPKDPETLQMLMKVEEKTQHYSSAIVYCNKLLELSPYDYALWRKKISLFRLQGNEEEVARLLKRLEEIYPDRPEVKKEIAGGYESQYLQYRRSHNKAGQEAALRKLVSMQPSNAEYQMALCNLLLQTGRTEDALDVAGHAATQVADPYLFVVKKASILAGMTRYNEALAYIKSEETRYPGLRGRLTSMTNELEREQARMAARNDPYTAYGRLYEKDHSEEALRYLLNTSMSRGYLEDALTYIREARRRYGDTQNLMYREYTVQRRMGNIRAATAMLEKMHAKWPDDVDVNEELCALQLEDVRRMMDFQQWDEAVALLEKISTYKLDPETGNTVAHRLFSCYVKTGMRMKALLQIDRISKDDKTRAGLYEEVMLPYIKQLISQGMLRKAEKEIRTVLDMGYPSADILSMSISTELSLKHNDNARWLVETGKKLYPDNPYFQLKEAQLMIADGEYMEAYNKLNSLMEVYEGDSTVVNAYAECCESLARLDIKAGDYDAATTVIDKGLEADPANQPLLLDKSMVYEKKRDWEKAIEAYRLYHPSYAEMGEYHQRMERLRRHLLSNQVTVYYQRARPSNEDNITSQASMTYSRTHNRDTYSLGLVYAGRDGFTQPTDSTEDEGGHGIQVNGGWQHQWGDRLTSTLSAGVATKFLPRIKVGVGATYSFDHDWTGTGDLSYRLIGDNDKASLIGASAGATKDLNPFSLGANLHAFYMAGDAAKLLNSKFFFNGGLTARCYPSESNQSYFYVAGSVGNAPELSLIDNSMPVKFDQLNTMLGAGGFIVINSMIDLGVEGTWYNMTISSSSSGTNHSRNYLYLGAYVTVHF